ncbi:MAG: lytic transglycosylase domain-containing protein [Rhodobacteraceae bacterium]|nr:lytic transglycosylase domain-containing protein [Paracoccaceae bacterium]
MAGTAPDRQAAARAGTRVSGALTWVVLLLSGLGFSANAAAARTDLATLCESAAHAAAAESGVPQAVMRAISLAETGRKRAGRLRPWPWTVNMEGTGKWFDTQDEALAYVERHFDRGARSFDIGCFQINYRWHGQAFTSVGQMFDPLANARYAAAFLRRLFAETGDWSLAAGAYHSRTKEYADRYRTRFDRLRAELEGAPLPPAPGATLLAASPDARPAKRPRVNTFPLLRAAATGRLGSLVPIGGDGAQPLIALD